MSRFCEKCGTSLNSNETSCSNCGAKVIRAESPPESTSESTSTTTSDEQPSDTRPAESLSIKILYISFGVAFLVLLIVGIMPSTNRIGGQARESASVEQATTQSATVPDFVGKTPSDAVAALKVAGVEVKISDAYDDKVPAGKIISQSPNSGAKISRGQTLYVYVSKGVDPAKSVAPLTEADFVIDGVTLGMSKADVDTKLGAGERGLIGEFMYDHLFIFFTADGKVSYISFANDGIRTARKVSVGSTLAALERIYGTNYRRDEDNENTFVAVYALGNLELRFSVVKKTSKVNSISILDTNLYVPPIPKSKTPAPLTEADLTIGGLTFGMSRADVERKLGKSAEIRKNDWCDFGKNIGVHFKGGVSSDVIGVAAENFGTSRNVVVGSTLADVEKAYGTKYRRHNSNSNDKEFSIEYSLGEKLLAFIVDKDTNRVKLIFAVEDINALPSSPGEKPKPQPKPQKPREQPTLRVNDRDAAERVLKEFTSAYMNRDRAGMESCSFYEERNFTREEGYELLDTQMNVWDLTNQVYTQTFGNSYQYSFEILSMSKINADTYKAEVVLILGPDTLSYPNIRVCNVGGRWLVDADSFAYSASMSAGKVFLGY